MARPDSAANRTAIREEGVGRVVVSGDLGKDTVVALRKEAEQMIEQRLAGGSALQIELSEVGRTDSAGLALLLHWLRRAQAHGARVEFLNVPRQMLAIARTSRVQQYLLHEDDAR